MVVVSQIWVQCLQCMAIIGHCHIRVGSELEPELGGSLYTALVIALSEIEQSPVHEQYAMSGVYGYRVPDEGIGLFTVQRGHFRVFFLCEGLYSRGIPFLSGKKISKRLKNFFDQLERTITQDHCYLAHESEEDEYFWFNLIFSAGLGENIPLEELETIFPLRLVKIKVIKTDDKPITQSLESSELGTLGYGWGDIDQLVEQKVQGIFNKPQFSFFIYESLFHQIVEFVPDFKPNTIILSYHTGDLQEDVGLIAMITFRENELNIRYCLPILLGLELEGSHKVQNYLRSMFLEPD
ncbi:MAG: hypothetical protein JSV04_04010 [Candidatus Heimdallarchaeota archaeon]|nr:MAG: hypothetical protein JSV04_04010 [Candidatus Heimdallarchaeota archaeon]